MVIKIVFIMFLLGANLIIYSMLNRTNWVNKKFSLTFVSLFFLFIIFDIGLMGHTAAIKWKFLLPSLLFLVVPVLTFYWLEYFIIVRIKKLAIQNEKFLNFGIKVFSFFFLKFIYLIVFTAQCTFLFLPDGSMR